MAVKSVAYEAASLLLGSIKGENPKRPGLIETPGRVMKAWDFWTSGYDQDPSELLKLFEDGESGPTYDELVFQGNIPLYSHCEHHMTSFFGVAHVGYIAKGKVVGLSKLSRVLDVFARRLQVQERIGIQVADTLSAHLSTDVGVVLRCRHLCMESRGIQRPGTITYTSALRGKIKEEHDCRAEFMQFVALADAGPKPI